MPRKKTDINMKLWMKYAKPWMKAALKILAQTKEPIPTSTLLDKILEENPDIIVRHNTLLRWLHRLEHHGIIKRYRIGYYKRYAWMLTEEIKKQIMNNTNTE